MLGQRDIAPPYLHNAGERSALMVGLSGGMAPPELLASNEEEIDEPMGERELELLNDNPYTGYQGQMFKMQREVVGQYPASEQRELAREEMMRRETEIMANGPSFPVAWSPDNDDPWKRPNH